MRMRKEKGPRLTLVWGPRMVNPALQANLSHTDCQHCNRLTLVVQMFNRQKSTHTDSDSGSDSGLLNL